MYFLHNTAVLGSTPEHTGEVRRRGESLHPTHMASENIGCLFRVEIMNADVGVGSSTHQNTVVRIW